MEAAAADQTPRREVGAQLMFCDQFGPVRQDLCDRLAEVEDLVVRRLHPALDVEIFARQQQRPGSTAGSGGGAPQEQRSLSRVRGSGQADPLQGQAVDEVGRRRGRDLAEVQARLDDRRHVADDGPLPVQPRPAAGKGEQHEHAQPPHRSPRRVRHSTRDGPPPGLG